MRAPVLTTPDAELILLESLSGASRRSSARAFGPIRKKIFTSKAGYLPDGTIPVFHKQFESPA